MASSVEPSLDVGSIVNWAAAQLARAARAAETAKRHERLKTSASTERARAFHAHMAAIHRRIEQRHRTAARLHNQFAVRVGRWASRQQMAGDPPKLVGIVAADLGSPSLAITLAGPNSAVVSGIASDPMAAQAQSIEFELGEGPAHEVTRAGRPVLACLSESSSRWPHYAPMANRLGVAAVAAVPLREATTCFGALMSFEAAPVGPPSGFLDRLSAMADVLTHTMLLAGEPVAVEDGPAGPLLRDLDHQAVTCQAAGMVAAQCDCTVEDALVLLKARAFATDQRAHAVAQQVVNRTIRFDTATEGNSG